MPKQERPARVTHQHEMVGEQKTLATSEIPYAYLAKHQESATEACCKDPANLTYHVEKTDPSLPEANKAVIACACGRKHIRFAGASGRL